MGKLVLLCSTDLFCLEESPRDSAINTNLFKSRQVIFHTPYDWTDEENNELIIKIKKACRYQDALYDAQYSNFRDNIVISDDINPWIMRLNNRLVVYFGADKPVIKAKTVTNCTQHFKYWTSIQYKLHKPELYHYAEVKEHDRLFIFSNSYKFEIFHPDAEIIDGTEYLTKYDFSEAMYQQKKQEYMLSKTLNLI